MTDQKDDLVQSQIKAAEAAALRRAAAVADAKYAAGEIGNSGHHILALISDDQQSALDAYADGKVGEALDRADAEIKAAVLILVRAVDLGIVEGNKTTAALDLLRAKFSPNEIATGVLAPSEQ